MGLGSSVVTGYVRWPSHPGQRWLTRWLARRLLSERGIIIRLNDGSRLWLNPADADDFAILRHLDATPRLASFLQANVKPGQLVLSTGVGNGLTLIRLSKLVGPEGKVIGIEHRPAALLRAHENVLANELSDNISFIAGRLGSQAGISADGPSLTGKEKASRRRQIQVLTESLPELLYRLSLRRADFLLLDDTAHSREILQGITPASRPRLILFTRIAQDDVVSLQARITELGYRCFNPTGEEQNSANASFGDYLVATDREDIQWLVHRKGKLNSNV